VDAIGFRVPTGAGVDLGPKKTIVRVLYVWTAQNSGHCNDKASLVLYPPRTKKVSKVNYSLNAKNCNVRGVSTFFFDTCSNLGHLFSYDFKDLHDHFPEILIAKFKRFIYCIGLFDIISKNSVKFPPSWAYLYGNNIYYKN
jgi:hypothetical protein